MAAIPRACMRAALAASAMLAPVAPALAFDAEGRDPGYVSFGAGWFDAAARDDDAVDFRLEYRHATPWWIFKPWAGAELTGDGALYGAAGVLSDLYLGERIVVTPSVGAGFFEESSGKDLGGTVQFRPQIELSYRFADRSRLGVGLSHISNAGIYSENPGTEIVTVYYHIPTTRLTQALQW